MPEARPGRLSARGVRLPARPEVALEVVDAQPAPGGWRGRAEGTLTDRRLQRPLPFVAEGGLIDGAVALELTGPTGPLLVEQPVAGGHVTVPRVRVQRADGVWRAEAPIGAVARGWALTGADLRVERADGRWRLNLAGGRLRRLALEPAGAAADAPSPGAEVDALLDAVEVHVTDLDLRLTDPRLPAPLAVTVEAARWADGVGSLTARTLGGVVEVLADTAGPDHHPRGLDVVVADLDARSLATWLGRGAEHVAGRLDGRLTALALDEALPGPAWVRLEAAVREGVVDHRGLAEAPVDGVDGRVTLVGAWRPDLAGWTVPEVELARGPLRVRGAARLDDADVAPRLGLELAVDPIDCAAAYAAVPRALLGPVAGARLRGTLATRATLDLPLWDARHLDLKLIAFDDACAVDDLGLSPADLPGAPTLEGRPVDAERARDVAWLEADFVRAVPEARRPVQVGPGAPGYVPLAALPDHVRAAMWLSEEVGFARGNALSAHLIERALKLDLEAGRFVYGGSTITQQLVKNLFLQRRKTLARKVREAVIAARVADALPRDRVLELYLNCIEFAPDVYGIGAAAAYYFQKPASALTVPEAVFLARMKPHPRFGPVMKRRGSTGHAVAWHKYNGNILNRLQKVGAASAEAVAAARGFELRWAPDGTYLGDRPDDG
ncbi:MAG: transglycosylase domain-containing protein [Myxococcales bacterium]|nr:transglycosylase domain-containing protein [Myxococcales bacterium]